MLLWICIMSAAMVVYFLIVFVILMVNMLHRKSEPRMVHNEGETARSSRETNLVVVVSYCVHCRAPEGQDSAVYCDHEYVGYDPPAESEHLPKY